MNNMTTPTGLDRVPRATLIQLRSFEAVARLGGVGRLALAAPTPRGLVAMAVRQVRGNGAREFVVVYLNDMDLAGHAWGWMSPAYRQTAGTIDRALWQLLPLLDDPSFKANPYPVWARLRAEHGSPAGPAASSRRGRPMRPRAASMSEMPIMDQSSA